MEIEVRCYGDVRAAVGEKRLRLELEPGATVADLLETLASVSPYDPDGVPSGKRLVVRRDRRHLDRDAELADGDSIGVTESPMPER